MAVRLNLNENDGPDHRLVDTEGLGPHDIDEFTALRTQLGLRLEKKTTALEFFAIGRWEKPSEN